MKFFKDLKDKCEQAIEGVVRKSAVETSPLLKKIEAHRTEIRKIKECYHDKQWG
jgi:hypothetical protein